MKPLRNVWKDQVFVQFFTFFSRFLTNSEEPGSDFCENEEKIKAFYEFFKEKGFKKSQKLRLLREFAAKLSFENMKLVIKDQLFSENARNFCGNARISRISKDFQRVEHNFEGEIVIHQENIEKLQFFNSVLYLKKRKYYLFLRKPRKYVRISLETPAIVSVYSPFSKEILYFSSENPRQTVNLLQIIAIPCIFLRKG